MYTNQNNNNNKTSRTLSVVLTFEPDEKASIRSLLEVFPAYEDLITAPGRYWQLLRRVIIWLSG